MVVRILTSVVSNHFKTCYLHMTYTLMDHSGISFVLFSSHDLVNYTVFDVP